MKMAVLRFDCVDSTNEVAKRLVAEGRIRGRAAIVAREQTAGKGTRGRSWVSPRDAGIYLSLVDASLSLPPPALNDFTLGVGRACAEVLSEVVGAAVRVKPINDLYLAGGKLAGLLTETVVEGDTVCTLITGLGINTARADRPVDGQAIRPTCLEEHLSPQRFAGLNVPRLIDRLAAKLGRCHDELIHAGQSIKMGRVAMLKPG